MFAATAPPVWLKEKLPRLVCPRCASRQTAANSDSPPQGESQVRPVPAQKEPALGLPAGRRRESTSDEENAREGDLG
ncbi:hypothetical protein KTAU_44040 [Thermogemmatispora aurantia]|uniref:Uncharacterized protein n=1 Tax=Thermogemmatispora aurantia TaxID=2045279 RepID=A0A5J4KHL9_9CHLR|nr:hypothetical protein KTAU_44040 [Thermogemmatispora aurantia]